MVYSQSAPAALAKQMSTAIHNSHEEDTTQSSTDGQINPHDGIQFSHKKEWSTHMMLWMDELWRYYAKWKKPDKEGHRLYNFIYVKYPE